MKEAQNHITFDKEHPETVKKGHENELRYSYQAHLPVRQQDEGVWSRRSMPCVFRWQILHVLQGRKEEHQSM